MATATTQNWHAFEAPTFWHITDPAGTIYLITKTPEHSAPVTTEAAAIASAQALQSVRV